MSMLFKRIKDWAVSIASFRTGDVIAVDGPNGTAKMSKDDLLKEMAQSSLASSVAPAFDPTRTEDNKYLAKQTCIKDGVLYEFIHDHFGDWNDNDAIARPVSELYARTNDVQQISKKVQSVDTESIFESESDDITIEDDNGNEIVKINESGANFRGLKKDDKDVLTEGEYPMESETLSTLDGSVVIEDDDGNEIIRVDENGVFVLGKKIRNNVVVAADGSGDYTSIQSAIDASDNGSVIIVMPGEYEESVDIGHKEIYLIGMNKDTCIVRQGKRDYYHPPLWIGCGFVSNMTFYLYNGGEVITPDMSTYAVHLDQRWYGSRSVTFDNCKFKNDWLGSTIGCGVSKDCKIRLINCEFENNASSAAFQVHTSNAVDCIGEWNYIEMIGCYCTGSNASAGVLLANSSASSIENASGVKCRFIGNDIGFYSTITSAYQLQKGSFNNTNSNLNYGG